MIMFFLVTVLWSFAIVNFANPVPQSSDDSFFSDASTVDTNLPVSLNAKCMSEVFMDETDENNYERRIFRRLTACSSSSMSSPPASNGRQPNGRQPNRQPKPSTPNGERTNGKVKPSTKMRDNPCLKESKAVLVACGGPEVFSDSDNAVLNCDLGEFIKWLSLLYRKSYHRSPYRFQKQYRTTRKIQKDQKGCWVLL